MTLGFSCSVACGIFPDQGSSWCPLHCSILTTEPPGKPILLLLKKIYAYGQRLNNQYKVYEVKLVEDEWFFFNISTHITFVLQHLHTRKQVVDNWVSFALFIATPGEGSSLRE